MRQKNNKKTFTRREFIKGIGGGALGAAVVPRLLPQEAAALKTNEGNIPVYDKKLIKLTVNGNKYSLLVEPRETLLYVLREKLNLAGAKKVCDRGECGGCTVLLDTEPVYACMYLAVRAGGKSITTVEGLAQEGQLHPVQEAFIAEDAYQCGFCTPGFIMSSVALLNRSGNPGLEDIKKGLSGNLCRCGNYFKIYDAVATAAKGLRRS
ncbi:MAG: (2Fe-2S)-binding protein [Candidatus Aminicenantes bacterium]|jgi:aerobic-type carbon monoxide dehydrogenase small subunit (CoxS/CutS family)